MVRGPMFTGQEITQFLAESRIAVVGTINKNGSPHLTPTWYYYDGSQLTFITTKERVKYFNLLRDNRITVFIYECPLAHEYVEVRGTATFKDQDIMDDARRIAERYVERDRVEEHIEPWKTQPRVIATVTPRRIRGYRLNSR